MCLADLHLQCIVAKLYYVKSRDVNRRIEKLGGKQVSQRGSHRKYAVEQNDVKIAVIVPQHTGDIPIGTLRQIEKSFEPVFGKGWLK